MEETARLMRIASAWAAYQGQLPASLKTVPGQINDNVNLNFARPIVDAGVDFLFGDDVGFEIQDDMSDNPKESPGNAYLRELWTANNKMTTLGDLALNGAVCGDAFLKVREPDETHKYPRLIVLDPATVTPIWSADDFTDVLSYVITWNTIDPYSMQPMVRRQLIERGEAATGWYITDQVSRGTSKVFTTIAEDVWPFAWAPVFHCQNLPAPNQYWGTSDLETDIVDVIRSINFTMSNTNRIIRFHAHPKTWGSGFAQKDLNTSVDATIVLPNKDAKLVNLEMQSDLGSSIEVYKRFKEALHEIASIPEIATGKVDSAGALSGVALNILYRPLINKTKKKQLRYGDMLRELNRCLLEMGGMSPGSGNLEIHWPNILPVDDFQEAQTAVVLDQLGVSKQTLLTRLGFDPELEAEKKAAEQKTAMDMGAAMLSQFDKGSLDGQAPPDGVPAGAPADK